MAVRRLKSVHQHLILLVVVCVSMGMAALAASPPAFADPMLPVTVEIQWAEQSGWVTYSDYAYVKVTASDGYGNAITGISAYIDGTLIPGSSNFVRSNFDSYLNGTELSAEYLLPDGWSLYGNYDAQVNGQQVFHVGSGGVSYQW
jgi:hypothetical protein